MGETILIKFFGTKWCPDCARARKLLEERGFQYELIDIDRDPEARKFVEKVNHGNRSVPTIVFPDGSILVEPKSTVLSSKLDEFIEN
jgi:mycoredoxin